LWVVASRKRSEGFTIVVEGREKNKPAFTARSILLPTPQPHSKLSWVNLEGPTPQAILSYYTGGAHCCMSSVIATKLPSGKWTIIEAGSLDGEFGPDFEDLDGDGTRELLSVDNGFLYAFDSYAGSAAPAKIEKLVGGKIVDVTRDARYRRYHVQYLAWLEDRASEDDWKSNGFLAGWVAQKIIVGEGAEAWERMLKTYNRATSDGLEICTEDKPTEVCPPAKLKKVSFPEALRRFLDDKDYR
jgi:hypothetical protein